MQAVYSASARDKASAIMSTKVVTVKTTERVEAALRKMLKHKIGSIIALEKGKAIGIITERDISIRVARGQSLRGLIVRNVMTTPLITVAPTVDIWDAVEKMVRNDIRRLPVVFNRRLIGMVTERDVLRWLLITAYEPKIPSDLRKLLERRAHAHSPAH
jgi:CBS domain-containing protein